MYHSNPGNHLHQMNIDYVGLLDFNNFPAYIDLHTGVG